MADCIIGGGKSQFGRNHGPEIFFHIKVVIAQNMVEPGFELGRNGLQGRKALEVPVNEVTEVKGELQFVPVQLADGFFKLPGTFAIEAGPGRIGVGILAVGHEPEGEEGLFL